MKKNELDEIDKKILKELARDSNRSYRKLAEDIGMSPAATIDRVRKLEDEGYIEGYGCKLNYEKLGYEFMGIMEMNLSGKLLDIEKEVADLRGVAAIYDTTGENDAIAILMCKSRDELSSTVKKILKIEGVEDSNTHIVLNVLKRFSDFESV